MTGLICSLPLLASLYSACSVPAPLATGYVEGEYVLIAPVETAEIEKLLVKRGERVESGAALAEMEMFAPRIALAEAEAALAQADAQLADLKEGKRPEEIAVIEAELVSARAQSDEMQRTADRLERLAETGSATSAQRDDAITGAQVAAARVAEIEANLAVARLPARSQTIAAGQAQLEGARAARDRAAWALGKRSIVAPAAGTVTDIIRTEGEIAGPSAPILSLLPDGAVKLRLYVPAESVAAVSTGSTLQVNCDGCPTGLVATVSYVSDQPEFTPPVIYSLENRQKLVYLVEARPADTASILKPGQIVDVVLSGGGE